MDGLEYFNAGYSAIEQLPDSFGGLVNLVRLSFYGCKNLRNLPNSIWKLKLLKQLDLNYCSNLEQLPEQLEKMQCLEWLDASNTAIEQLPDSIGLLGRLKTLCFRDCKELKFVPQTIWNLTSVEYLILCPGEMGKISLPISAAMNMLKSLELTCDVRLCLPLILCFSSLERLTLTDEGQILSSPTPFSLSKLSSLQVLQLHNCTSLGSSLPELPLNLQRLYICNHTSLEQLPDLSSLRKLECLYIQGCIRLQSISLLPSHLQTLEFKECTSLQDLSDLSMLKELRILSFKQCNNLKSISLKPSCFQVGIRRLRFEADLPNREIADWFKYKSSGHTVSFVIPPSFGSNFLRLGLWVVYVGKTSKENPTYIKAVITNETEGITEKFCIDALSLVGEAQSRVESIRELLMKSGDIIKVSIPGSLYKYHYTYDSELVEEVIGEVKVKMIGVHVIEK